MIHFISLAISLSAALPQQSSSTEPASQHSTWNRPLIGDFDPFRVIRDNRFYRRSRTEGEAADQAFQDGRYRDAERYYHAALAIDPMWEYYAYDLAESQARQGRTREAIATYRSIVYPPANQAWTYSDSYDARTLLRYCVLLCETHQWPEAVAVFDKAVRPETPDEDPEWRYPAFDAKGAPDYTKLLAWTHFCLGKGSLFNISSAEALQQFDTAIKLKPDWEQAQFYLANTLQEMRRNDEARAIFEKLEGTKDPVLKDALVSSMESFR